MEGYPPDGDDETEPLNVAELDQIQAGTADARRILHEGNVAMVIDFANGYAPAEAKRAAERLQQNPDSPDPAA